MSNKKAPSAEECEQILKQKLADLVDDSTDERSSFIASFALDLPKSPEIENVNNDPLREKAFADATLAGVIRARQLLDECKIPYVRPNDFFAEMVKSDEQMERIRGELETQMKNKEKIMARNKEKRELKAKVNTGKKEQKRLYIKPLVFLG